MRRATYWVINRATIIHVIRTERSRRVVDIHASRLRFDPPSLLPSSLLSPILGDTREALFAQGIVFPLLAHDLRLIN